MITALILAGGRATRMGGADKPALVVGGEPIFARQVRVLAPRVTEIVVAANTAHPLYAGHRVVPDAIEGAGPLAGVAAGLAACATPWLLVVAGDMPDLTGALIDRITSAIAPGRDAVGIRIRGLPEPLVCALRAAAAAPALDAMLAEGVRKASALLTDRGLATTWIDDVDPAVVRNVNTPADLI
ncbi:MAG: molybdenum cofactor guanylyltransferase [Myxococcales bacterium]|nr:molybdenum cofactor guanylyltransferase [Myxococcales bacterium]